jgi:signal transduction histidine kinase
LLFLIALATLPALIFVFFAAVNEGSAQFARAKEDALHLANLASREHRQQIQGARELLRWLGDKLAREGTQSTLFTDPDFIQALLAGHPQLANIGILSPDGEVLASAYPLPHFPAMRDNPAFIAALESDDVATGRYIVSPIFEQPTLNHAYAVRDADGHVICVLFTGLNLDWLSEMARQIEFPGPFSLLIADREGRVLTYAGSTKSEIAAVDGMRIPEIATLSETRRGQRLEIHGAGVRGYFVAVPMGEDPNLYVAVGLPHAEVLQVSNSVFYRTLGALGLLTLFTAAAVYFAAELAVLRALRSLAKTVTRFGSGDLSARVAPLRGYNELTSVAWAFNAMADSLAAQHHEALEAQAELRALSGRLRQAREAEAARIARELHDEIGQLLTSLKIELSHLPLRCNRNSGRDSCARDLSSSIDAMNQRIAAAIDFVRRISSELRPSVLDNLGLAAALEWQARELESHTGLVIHVEAVDVEPVLDELVSVTLFRIAQEALTNIVRHAEAAMANVHLFRTERELVLEVEDDGKGFAASAVEPDKSLGIVGMRERALLINGQLIIEGTPGQGTRVRVCVPLPPEPEELYAHSSS